MSTTVSEVRAKPTQKESGLQVLGIGGSKARGSTAVLDGSRPIRR